MRIRCGFLSVALILCAVPGAWADQSPNAPVEFDIHSDGDLLIIPVKIHGKTYPFVLDTGCACSVIDRSLLRGEPKETVKSNKKEMRLYQAPAMRIGHITWQATDLVVGEDLTELREISGHQFYGLVGMDFLVNYAVQIDFDLGKLRLARWLVPPLGKKVPIIFLQPKKSRPLVIGELAGWGPELHLIDTGDIGFGNLNQDLFRALARKGRVGDLVESKSATFWGVHKHYAGWLEGLSLTGGPSGSVGLGESRRGPSDLGLGFWRRYNVTFDFPKQTLTFEKSRWFDKDDDGDQSGVAFQRKGKSTVVLEVKDGSPGAKAGLRPGDIVLKIDGKDAASFRFAELWKLFSKGKKIPLVYQRDHVQAEVLLSLDAWKTKRAHPLFLKEEPSKKVQAQLLYSRALAFAAKNDVQSVLTDVDESVRLNPQQTDSYYLRSKIWGAKKEYAKAMDDLNTAVGVDPKNARLFLERAKVHWACKDPRNALADLQEFLRQSPNSSFAWKQMCQLYAAQGDFGKAVESIGNAIRLDPADADSISVRAALYVQLKQPEKAMNDLEKAIAVNPRCGSAYGSRGIILVSNGEYEKALPDLKKGIELGYRVAQAYWARAKVYHKQKNYENEIDDLQQALRLDPNDAWANNLLAWTLATCPNKGLRDGRTALAHAQKACQLANYQHAVFLETLAAAHAELGDFPEAVRRQNEAIRLHEAAGQSLDVLVPVSWRPTADPARMRLVSYEKRSPTRE